MRVTSKGQVTIPIGIREQLGFHPGSEVEFSVENGVAQLRKVEDSRRGWELVQRMRGRATVRDLSTDEIMALTRGE